MEILVLIVVILVVTFIFAFKSSNSVDSETKDANKVEFPLEQKKLIDKPYKLQCKDDIFNEHELEILYKYGAWLSALAANQVKAETIKQVEFVNECQAFRLLPLNDMLSYFTIKEGDNNVIQSTWLKYICRIKFERENLNIISHEVSVNWGWQGPPVCSGDNVFFSN
jgi:hypothetical protein